MSRFFMNSSAYVGRVNIYLVKCLMLYVHYCVLFSSIGLGLDLVSGW